MRGLPSTEDGRRAARRLVRRLDALQRVVLAGSGVQIEAYLIRTRLPLGGRAVARVLVHAAHPEQVVGLRATCRGASAEPVPDGPGGKRMLELAFDLRGHRGPDPA